MKKSPPPNVESVRKVIGEGLKRVDADKVSASEWPAVETRILQRPRAVNDPNMKRITMGELQNRLRENIRSKIKTREMTGVVIAREAGVPQGHLSNFLNSRRGLSLETMDRLLAALAISVTDLLSPADIQHWVARPVTRSDVELVPRISPRVIMLPRPPKKSILAVHCVDKALLRRWRSNDVAGRMMWNRFVFVDFGLMDVRTILPSATHGATLLIDRQYNALEPHSRFRPNLYVLQLHERLVVGRVSLLKRDLVIQPCDDKCAILAAPINPPVRYTDYLVGRVCQLRAEA